MRIALLSAVKNTISGDRAAFLPFLGRTVLAAQFELALELGAERIVCMAVDEGAGQAAEVLALQHQAEQRSVDFHIIASHLALARLVSADHELITIEDGVLIDRAAVSAEMATERGVLCVPAEAGMARGFERIDAQWAWAGLMIIRGDLAAKLADLPADSDPSSLLLRLALQARVPIVALGEDHLNASTILLPRSAQELEQRETRLLGAALEKHSWSGPGTKLARIASLKAAPRALPKGSNFTAIASGALGFGAVCLAAFSLPIASGIALVLTALSAAMHGGFSEIEAGLKPGGAISSKSIDIRDMRDIMTVISLIIIMGVAGPTLAITFAPMAIIALRLAVRSARRMDFSSWQHLWEDRITLSILLTAAMAFGQLGALLAGLSLAALAFALICDEKFGLRQA